MFGSSFLIAVTVTDLPVFSFFPSDVCALFLLLHVLLLQCNTLVVDTHVKGLFLFEFRSGNALTPGQYCRS